MTKPIIRWALFEKETGKMLIDRGLNPLSLTRKDAVEDRKNVESLYARYVPGSLEVGKVEIRRIDNG